MVGGAGAEEAWAQSIPGGERARTAREHLKAAVASNHYELTEEECVLSTITTVEATAPSVLNGIAKQPIPEPGKENPSDSNLVASRLKQFQDCLLV